jgi:hypothetical protein
MKSIQRFSRHPPIFLCFVSLFPVAAAHAAQLSKLQETCSALSGQAHKYAKELMQLRGTGGGVGDVSAVFSVAPSTSNSNSAPASARSSEAHSTHTVTYTHATIAPTLAPIVIAATAAPSPSPSPVASPFEAQIVPSSLASSAAPSPSPSPSPSPMAIVAPLPPSSSPSSSGSALAALLNQSRPLSVLQLQQQKSASGAHHYGTAPAGLVKDGTAAVSDAPPPRRQASRLTTLIQTARKGNLADK